MREKRKEKDERVHSMFRKCNKKESKFKSEKSKDKIMCQYIGQEKKCGVKILHRNTFNRREDK